MKTLARLLIIALLGLTYGCAGPVDPPPSSIAPIDSAKVQAALANIKTDPELAGCEIHCKAQNALLVIDGKVNSEDAKQRAETLAKKVQGIKSVANHLVVENKAPVPGESGTL
jgi:hypothetical protein